MMPWNQPRQQYSRPDHRRHFDENARSPMSSSSGLAQRAAQGQVPATLPYTTERNLQTSRPGNDDATWGDKPAYCRPHPSEVVAAVETLYADQLKPFGRILLKRVRECNAAAATAAARTSGDSEAVVDVDAVPLIDPKCLRRICETCEAIRVEPEDGKEYSALLTGRLRDFVDVSSPSDDYPPNLWAAAAAYFESLQGPEMLLPGGRYACAQVLIQRQLPFLAGRSLGAVCHIVQLAVSQKRILGYLEGNMVPFGRSVDFIKEQCAVYQQPVSFAKKAVPEMPLASWEEARICLWEILCSASVHGQPGVITLSNVKRLFRSRFNLELSETALGHSRLNELLQDPRFSDICCMELQGKSQVVVQRVCDPAASAAAAASTRQPPSSYWQAFGYPAPMHVEQASGMGAHGMSWLSHPSVDDGFNGHSRLPAGLLEEEQPSAGSCDILSRYVQQLLELGDNQKGDALEALSSYTLQQPQGQKAVATAQKKTTTTTTTTTEGTRRTLSASCSTGDEGSVGLGSEDGEQDSDADAARPPAASVPTPAFLAPPPGLASPLGLGICLSF